MSVLSDNIDVASLTPLAFNGTCTCLNIYILNIID